jgi:hypothetical protein
VVNGAENGRIARMMITAASNRRNMSEAE